jgi:hypothetical protein
MSSPNSIAWPFSVARTLMIAAFDAAIMVLAGAAIVLVWSLG